MLVFKKNIYFVDCKSGDGLETGPPQRDREDPKPIAYNFIHSTLANDQKLFDEIHQTPPEDGAGKLKIFFPHSSRFGNLLHLDTLSKNLMEGFLDKDRWFLMNNYHLCYLYDSLLDRVEEYSYSEPGRRLEVFPEMLGQPINFNQFLNEYFFSTSFLVAAERFNRMTPQEKNQLGKLDHAYFGAVLPTPSSTNSEDPTLGKVINAVEPTAGEMALEFCPENPYQK